MSIDLSQFLQAFYEESFEGLEIMESELLGLDVGAADPETINTIFRAAHSIKGGSGTFGLNAVSSFTHIMETLLDEMRDGRRSVSQPAVEILLSSVDVLRGMLTALQDDAELDHEGIAGAQAKLEELLRSNKFVPASTEYSLNENKQFVTEYDQSGWIITFKPYSHLFKTGNDPVRMFKELAELGELSVQADLEDLPPFAEMDPEDSYLSWILTLRGDIERKNIAEIFEWVDGDCELTITPIASLESDAEPQKQELPATLAGNDPSKEQVPVKTKEPRESASIRVSIDKVDALINMVGELVITQSMLSQFGEDTDEFNISHLEKLRDGLSQLERNTRELQESVMRIRMLPISFAFQRFPRLVHDLQGKLGKKVELKISGEQTELDKTVMEKIGDPLVHLVRNSMDHGIEIPQVRLATGKPETGLIHLNAYHQGGNIVIEVSDDGAGLNKEKLLAKARERGLVKDNEVLSDEQIYEQIFQPGFSTANEVSDVSGRGVGMDVVRKNIKALGGRVDVISVAGQGTTFTIRLPLTLAILDGQSVRVGQETYILPLVSIVESLQARPERISMVTGRAEVYKLRNEYIPIVRLYNVFGVCPDSTNLKDGLLVVVEGEGKKVALFVDDLLGQQQVVIKSLETNFQRVAGISGATILGNGTVALILDISGLIQLSKNTEINRNSHPMAGGSIAAA
jgi:two-component system chemotaxis sensor kinase CheA